MFPFEGVSSTNYFSIPSSPFPPFPNVHPADGATDGKSVFVRNLPVSITQREIVEHMAQFGVVKVDKIQIRSNKVR